MDPERLRRSVSDGSSRGPLPDPGPQPDRHPPVHDQPVPGRGVAGGVGEAHPGRERLGPSHSLGEHDRACPEQRHPRGRSHGVAEPRRPDPGRPGKLDGLRSQLQDRHRDRPPPGEAERSHPVRPGHHRRRSGHGLPAHRTRRGAGAGKGQTLPIQSGQPGIHSIPSDPSSAVLHGRLHGGRRNGPGQPRASRLSRSDCCHMDRLFLHAYPAPAGVRG